METRAQVLAELIPLMDKLDTSAWLKKNLKLEN
ncbi:MAG: hypothetical protein Ct9H300mP28_22070 [Pseudomonadota bacterium]|nr:MAG: hypothetical protein Ct9H300mP28_22070 [Pseudomonadota bacterium]